MRERKKESFLCVGARDEVSPKLRNCDNSGAGCMRGLKSDLTLSLSLSARLSKMFTRFGLNSRLAS